MAERDTRAMVSAGWWAAAPPQQRQNLIAGRMLALPDGSWWLFGAWGRWYRWTPADGQWHLCPPPRLHLTRVSARPLQQGMPVPPVPPHVVPTGPDLAYDPPPVLSFVDAGVHPEITSRVRATVESAAALPPPEYPHWWGLFSSGVPSTVAVTWGVMLWCATAPVFDARIDGQLLGLWSAYRARPLPEIDGPRWLTPPPLETLVGLYTERLRAGRVDSAVVILRTMWAMANALREDSRFQPRADALIAMLGVTLQNPTVDYGALAYGDQAVGQQWLTRCPPSLAPALRVEASSGEHFRNAYYDLALAVTPIAGDPGERGYVEPRLIAAALLAADLAVVRQDVSSQVIGWLDPQVGEAMRAMSARRDHPLRRFWPDGDRLPRLLRERMDTAGPSVRNTLLATMYATDLAWCRLGGGIPARPRGFPSSVAILAEIIGPGRATSAASSEPVAQTPGIAPVAPQYPARPSAGSPAVPPAQQPPTGPPGQAPAWAAPGAAPATEAWAGARPLPGTDPGRAAPPPSTEAWDGTLPLPGTGERSTSTPAPTQAWSGTGEREAPQGGSGPATPPPTQAWPGAEAAPGNGGPGAGPVTPPPATQAWPGAEGSPGGPPSPAVDSWPGTGGSAAGAVSPPPATQAWTGAPGEGGTWPGADGWGGPPATQAWPGTGEHEAGGPPADDRRTGPAGNAGDRADPPPPAAEAWPVTGEHEAGGLRGAERADGPVPPATQAWPGTGERPLGDRPSPASAVGETPNTPPPATVAWSAAASGTAASDRSGADSGTEPTGRGDTGTGEPGATGPAGSDDAGDADAGGPGTAEPAATETVSAEEGGAAGTVDRGGGGSTGSVEDGGAGSAQESAEEASPAGGSGGGSAGRSPYLPAASQARIDRPADVPVAGDDDRSMLDARAVADVSGWTMIDTGESTAEDRADDTAEEGERTGPDPAPAGDVTMLDERVNDERVNNATMLDPLDSAAEANNATYLDWIGGTRADAGPIPIVVPTPVNARPPRTKAIEKPERPGTRIMSGAMAGDLMGAAPMPERPVDQIPPPEPAPVPRAAERFGIRFVSGPDDATELFDDLLRTVPGTVPALLIVGEPHTGQRRLTRLVARTLAGAGLGDGSVRTADGGELRGDHVTTVTAILRSAGGAPLLFERLDRAVLDAEEPARVVAAVTSGRKALIATCEPESYRRLATGYPQLTRMFKVFRLPDLSGVQARLALLHVLADERRVTVNASGLEIVRADLARLNGHGDLVGARLVEAYLDRAVARHTERAGAPRDRMVLIPVDFAGVAEEIEPALRPPRDVDGFLRGLDEMIGLEEVKRTVGGLVAEARMAADRAMRGLPSGDPSRHLIFLGRPGTGKATVAGLIGGIYAALNLLDTGQLVMCGARDFADDPAAKAGALVDRAMGGVLLIEDAYLLDRMPAAVEELSRLMTERRDTFMVICASPPDEMEGFLFANPGFRAEFGAIVEFREPTDRQLVQLFSRLAERDLYMLDEELRVELLDRFGGMRRYPGFAFADTVRRMFDQIVSRQAARLAGAQVSAAAVARLSVGDLPEAEGGRLLQRLHPNRLRSSPD